ncbi:MAG: TonB-dependent receptor [Cyclobacteriaceae bacterium]|nr:TonB-dependent receptor [Cyclobacteriaceae bacterium]MCH8515894.1 TonB-dependent receptor [Cyclobacteriaceae bacterium]
MQRLIGFFLVGMICLYSGPLKAQQEIDALVEQAKSVAWEKSLEEVVVTGSFEPQSLKESVYQIRTIDSDRIKKQGATQLQDVLRMELNIRFDQDLALGESRISMQGLSGQNVKVLIDGVPVIGRQGTSNAVNLNHFNVNTIDRIEIVEGPMSVIFGADAIAGVINIITKKDSETPFKIGARSHFESVGPEFGGGEGIHQYAVDLGFQAGDFYFRGDVARNYFGGFQGEATGRDREWHPKIQWMGSTTAGWRKGNAHIYYRFDLMDDWVNNLQNFSGREALDQEYLTRRAVHQLQWEQRFNSKWSLNSSFAYTDFSRTTRTIVTQRDTGLRFLAANANQDQNLFSGYNIRSVANYRPNQYLKFQTGVDLNSEVGEGGRLMAGRQSIQDYAAFVTAEFRPIPSISIMPGARTMYNSAFDAPPLVPSVNTRWNIGDKTSLKASYAAGFRAPSIRELYFNFFDASHSIAGNPDLESETSRSFNAQLSRHWIERPQSNFESNISLFHNRIDNMIGMGQSAADAGIITYLNIDEFRTQGINFNNTLSSNNWTAQLGASYIGRFNRLVGNEEHQIVLEDMTWTPEVNATLSYQIDKTNTSFDLFYKYTGVLPFYEFNVNETGQESIELATIDDFHWLDLTVNQRMGKYLHLQMGVRNILDVVNVENTSAASGAHSVGGPRPIGYGRSYFMGLQFRLN